MTGQSILSTLSTIITTIWDWLLGMAETLLTSDTFLFIFVFGVAVSIVMLLFKIMRKLMWGA